MHVDDSDITREEPLPPVVARMVVEIRSDGTRTMARGALQDAVTGQETAVAVEAQSPAELLGGLMRSLVSLPRRLDRSSQAVPDDASRSPRRVLKRLRTTLRRRIKRRR